MKIMLKNQEKTSVYKIGSRSIVCTGGTIYDLPEPDARILLNTGGFERWKKPDETPRPLEEPKRRTSVSIKIDKERISTEPHEQRYMKEKIQGLSKKKLVKLYEETEKFLEHEIIMDLMYVKKKEILEAIVKNFAEINNRKTVNKMIEEALL